MDSKVARPSDIIIKVCSDLICTMDPTIDRKESDILIKSKLGGGLLPAVSHELFTEYQNICGPRDITVFGIRAREDAIKVIRKVNDIVSTPLSDIVSLMAMYRPAQARLVSYFRMTTPSSLRKLPHHQFLKVYNGVIDLYCRVVTAIRELYQMDADTYSKACKFIPNEHSSFDETNYFDVLQMPDDSIIHLIDINTD